MYNSYAQSKISLEIACQGLKNRDTFSKSDPLCQVWLVDPSTHTRKTKLGQTEQIADNLNPRFNTKIPVHSNVLPGQLLEFVVVDADVTSSDSLGKCFMEISDIQRAGAQGYSLPLGKGTGRITVWACDAKQGVVKFMMRGINIKSKDFLSKSDPYIVIKQNGVTLYQSEHKDNTKSPKWNGFEISAQKINTAQDLYCECYDYDGMHSRPDLIGTATFNVDNITRGHTREYTLISKSGKQAGVICIDQCTLIKSKVKPHHGGAASYPHAYGTPPPQNHYGMQQPGAYGVQQPYAPVQQPGYPRNPYPSNPYPSNPYPTNPYPSNVPYQPAGYPPQQAPYPGMPQPGMPQPGMPQPGMPQPGMPQPGMPQPGMPQPGMPQPGMPYTGMPQPGMPQHGMPTQPYGQQPGIYPQMNQSAYPPPGPTAPRF